MAIVSNIISSLPSPVISPATPIGKALPILNGLRLFHSSKYRSFSKSSLFNFDGANIISSWKGLEGTPESPQSTVSLRPTYVENGINNLPSLQSDNDSLLLDSSLYDLSNDNITIIAVAEALEDNVDCRIINLSEGGSARTTIRFDPGVADGMQFCSSTSFSNRINVTGINKLQGNIVSFIRNGTSQNAYINGSLVGNNNTGANDPDVDSGFICNGEAFYSALLVYDRALSTVERQSVESFLSTEFFINLS